MLSLLFHAYKILNFDGLMNRNLRTKSFVVFALIYLFSSACFAAQSVPSTQVHTTPPAITFTYTPEPISTATVILTATNTPVPLSTDTPFPTATPIIPNKFSPEDIARVVSENDLETLNKMWRGPEKRSLVNFLSIYDNFSVQRLYIGTNSPDVEYALISIGEQKDKRTWLYLLFKREGATWQYFDEIELRSKYLIEPSYQIIDVDGNDIWLVVNWLANSGTGFALYADDWYKLNSEKLDITLRYPVNGHEEYGLGIPPAHVKFKAEVVGYEPDYQTGVYKIDLRFYAFYKSSFVGYKDILPEYYPVFSIERKARYLWDEERHRFVLDAEGSNVSQTEIDKLFHYNADEFLQYTYDELLEVATTGNKFQKKWLELMLEQAKDSPEKENLLKQLVM